MTLLKDAEGHGGHGVAASESFHGLADLVVVLLEAYAAIVTEKMAAACAARENDRLDNSLSELRRDASGRVVRCRTVSMRFHARRYLHVPGVFSLC